MELSGQSEAEYLRSMAKKPLNFSAMVNAEQGFKATDGLRTKFSPEKAGENFELATPPDKCHIDAIAHYCDNRYKDHDIDTETGLYFVHKKARRVLYFPSRTGADVTGFYWRSSPSFSSRLKHCAELAMDTPEVAEKVANFLRGHKGKKSPHVTKFLSNLERAIANNRRK